MQREREREDISAPFTWHYCLVLGPAPPGTHLPKDTLRVVLMAPRTKEKTNGHKLLRNKF